MKVVENLIQEGNHLSHSNDIKLLLDIQDKNMEVEENAVVLRSYQGQMTKFITAKLTFTLNIVDQSLYFHYRKTSIKTLKNIYSYIKHSLMYSYNNGRIEEINYKIKVWNRVTYGYRYFHHYKKKIILHFKWRSIIQSNKSSSPAV